MDVSSTSGDGDGGPGESKNKTDVVYDEGAKVTKGASMEQSSDKYEYKYDNGKPKWLSPL